MKRKFILQGLKPLSINSTYVRTLNGVMKTTAATEWTYTACHILSSEENKQKFKELRDFFDPKLHCLHMDILVYYPKDIFWTKKGEVSSRTQDVSNTEKSIVDIMLLKKFFSDEPPAGCQNLNTDDKYLLSMYSKKLVSSEHKIEVDLEILLLSTEV